jgi:bisphosphoglycerate-independent phosphoglycerate mutase (AlkP superfamily)
VILLEIFLSLQSFDCHHVVVCFVVQLMLEATEKVGGIFLITADHGNAEDMVKRNSKTGEPLKDKQGKYQILTAHTCAPVREGKQIRHHKVQGGRLCYFLHHIL